MTSTPKFVSLECKDGVIKNVSIETLKLSHVIKAMLEDIPLDFSCDDVNKETPVIPITNIRMEVMQKIIGYCEFYNIKKRPKTYIVWHDATTNVDITMLFEIMLSADFLDIYPLVRMTCAMVSKMLEDKTPDELRATFNIKKDFTPEEEAAVRMENRLIDPLQSVDDNVLRSIKKKT